ncbi:MAG: hypothetical protein ACOH10_14045, partial [Rhodoglobus sp.]
MSTTAVDPRLPLPARTSGPAGPGPSFPRVLLAEWTKLTSLRSRAVIAAVTVAASGALTYLAANASSTDPGFEPLDSLTSGLMLGQIGTLVLGVLVGTGEFSTGAFRTTFVAVPRRWPVLAAQTLATTAYALVVSVLAVGATVLGLLPAAGSRGMSLNLMADGTPRTLGAMVFFLVVMALVGLAFGALLRRPVPAIVTTVALVLVLPVALALASEPADPMEATAPATPNAIGTVVSFLPS